MKCDAFRQRLDDLLDQRASPGEDAQLSLHANHCDTCRDRLAATESLLAVLEYGAAKEVSKVTRSRKPIRSAKSLVTLAATLLIGVLGWSRLWPTANQPATESVAVVSTAVETVSASPQVSSDAASFVYQPLIGLSLISRADWSRIDAQMPFAAHMPAIESQWLRAVTDGMAPVQESMSHTLEVIRRSLSTGSRNTTINS